MKRLTAIYNLISSSSGLFSLLSILWSVQSVIRSNACLSFNSRGFGPPSGRLFGLAAVRLHSFECQKCSSS